LADLSRQAPTAKSIIFLALFGGPPHQDTFDLKEDAPAEFRGEFESIATTLADFRVCEYLPNLARLAHLYTVIRSVTHEDNAHETAFYSLMTGWPHPQTNTNARPAPTDYPCYGVTFEALKPPQEPVPGFVIAGGVTSSGIGQTPGFFGPHRAPFVLRQDASDPDFGVPELSFQTGMAPPRLSTRQSLLERFDELARSVDRQSLDRFSSLQSRAFEMLSKSKLRDAFDLSREPELRRDAYGRNPFGQNVLLARRLVEAGVPVVQINWRNKGDGGLDTHYDNFNQCKGNLLPKLDACLSALLIDLDERGLLDETLVVAAGEFGRTPRINPDAGRDHWAGCNSVLLAGGGVKRGFVFGSSNKIGAYPATNPVGPWDLFATILHCYGIDPETTLRDAQNRPHPLCRGAAIEDVLIDPRRSSDMASRPATLKVAALTEGPEAKSAAPFATRPLAAPIARVNPIDGGALMWIPGGEFVMGSDEYSIERPPHRVRVRPFWMARTPVTNAMYRDFVAKTGHRPQEFANQHLMNPKLWDGDEQPAIGVSYDDAVAYCTWAGGRLPTEAEWEFAARGLDGRIYPWGNEAPRLGRAAYGRILGKGGATAPVGTHPGDEGPFGVLDLAGNVLEWCADWFGPYPADVNEPLIDPRGPAQGTRRVQRGGCWMYDERSLRATERIQGVPHQRLNLVGFRLVVDAVS
jgi:formylglycine-generating enzyme required for sulfatase activity